MTEGPVKIVQEKEGCQRSPLTLWSSAIELSGQKPYIHPKTYNFMEKNPSVSVQFPKFVAKK